MEKNNSEDIKKPVTRKRRGRPRKKVENSEVSKQATEVPGDIKDPINSEDSKEVKINDIQDEKSADISRVSSNVNIVTPYKVTGTYMVRNRPISSSPVKKISGNFIIEGTSDNFYRVRYVKYSFGSITGYIKKSDIQ